MPEHFKNELKISLFGTTIGAVVLLLIFTGKVNFLEILLLNSISILACGISVLSGAIDYRYNMYIHRKKVEVIEKTYDDEFTRESHKQEGIAPKNEEYYKLVAPAKVLYKIIGIVFIPFVLWHSATQSFKPLYKKVFK